MYCLPAVIYIGLSIVGFLVSVLTEVISMGTFIINTLLTFLFAWFLDYLCRNGYPMTSWVLVLFPFVFMFALAAGAVIIHTTSTSMSPAPY